MGRKGDGGVEPVDAVDRVKYAGVVWADDRRHPAQLTRTPPPGAGRVHDLYACREKLGPGVLLILVKSAGG